jgi:hypothetical protein
MGSVPWDNLFTTTCWANQVLSMSFKIIGNKGKLDYFGELEHSLQAVVARLRENFCALRMLCTPTVWTEMGDEEQSLCCSLVPEL